MRNSIIYTAGEISRVRVVADFLPPPTALIARSKKDADGRDEPGKDDRGE